MGGGDKRHFLSMVQCHGGHRSPLRYPPPAPGCPAHGGCAPAPHPPPSAPPGRGRRCGHNLGRMLARGSAAAAAAAAVGAHHLLSSHGHRHHGHRHHGHHYHHHHGRHHFPGHGMVHRRHHMAATPSCAMNT